LQYLASVVTSVTLHSIHYLIVSNL
jgi:hypothetical protein